MTTLRPHRVALAVLVFGVAASALAWYLGGRYVQAQMRAQFASQADLSAKVVERRIQRYVDVLYGMDALADHDLTLSRLDFHRYASALELGKRFPGVQAVEFVRRVREEERAAFEERVREDRAVHPGGYPDFAVKPPGPRPEYWVVDYVEPLEGNEPAFGLDIRTGGSLPAAERALRTGEATLTGRYRLAQERGSSLGLVMYLPVFGAKPPTEPKARAEALRGFVNVVLRVDDLMAGVMAEPPASGLRLRFHDRGPVESPPLPVSAQTQIFRTPGEPWAEPLALHESRHTHAHPIALAGRQWLLEFESGPRLSPWLRPFPLFALGAGLLVTLLLRRILLDSVRASIESREVAERATRELRNQLSFTQQLIEAIPNPVFFKDSTGRYIGCNKAFEAYVGKPREQMMGRAAADVLPQDMAERSQIFDSQLYDRPGSQVYEANFMRDAEGRRRDVMINKATFFGPAGEVAGLVGVIADITQLKKLEAGTRESNERLRAVIQAAPLAIVARDLEGTITMWNPAAEHMFGWKEREVLGTKTSVVPTRLREEVLALRGRAERGETIWLEETRRMRSDGQEIDVSVTIAPIYGADGRVTGTMVTIVDITRRKQAEAALRESEARLRLAMDATQMGMWYWEPASDRFTCSEGLGVLFGRPRGEAPDDYRALQKTLHPDDREIFQATFRHALKRGSGFAVDYRVVWPDGSVHWVANRGQVQRGEDGRAERVIGVAMDITDRKIAEQRIAHMAHHDALTGLPNRVLLRDRIQQAIAQAHRDASQLAVLFIDLDRFKTINDSLGHPLGDRLLQAAASRLQVCVREGDTVSRVGGDEFVVVIPRVVSAGDASAVAAKILDVLSSAFHLHGNDLHVGASIGISLYPGDGTDAETLMRNADTAMYHAKDSGRNNFQFFTQHMNVAAQQRLQLETALRRALDAGEFELQYQPLYDLRDRSITGFEALVRWNTPEGGTIGPSQFISAAEESGLIVPIGDWVLREALREARAWQGAGRSVMVSINVSAHQLARGAFVERLRRLLEETGADPALVELEVTEGVIIEGAGEAREALDHVAALGVGIAIDDFGTGYSGLAYLKRLPIDTVKIDQSFVRDLTVDPDDAAIVTAIVAMARSLGIDVVAEGVETEEQLDELKRLGCHRAQGYLLARPMNALKVRELLGVNADAAVAD